MINATVKNGVTGIILPLSFRVRESENPVLIPTQVSVVSDSRTFTLDAEGVKNWLKSHEENAGFDAKEFLDEFYNEHAGKYARLTLMLGYHYQGQTYPITYELERRGRDYTTLLSVVLYEQQNMLTIDARCVYEDVPEWEDVIFQLKKAKNYLFHDRVVLPDVLFYLKQQLEPLGLKQYNLLVRHKNNIAVIEG